jgi:hypothetical protein
VSAKAAIAAVILTAFGAACRDRDAAKPETPASAQPGATTRQRALASARVWQAPGVPPGKVDFSANTPGPGALDATADVDCEFVLKPTGGTSPKFYCKLADGDVVKVKYGATNPEVPAEVAASRLMSALGFFVDRMMLVKSVRCRGCPPFPAQALSCMEKAGVAGACLQGGSPETVRTFERAMIERPFAGDDIEAGDEEGWAWFELDRIDPGSGGSPRAEVDALRLVAVVLAHWDNTASNQRLVCPAGRSRPDGSCRAPAAVIHDLGATFGPLKADLQNWKAASIWADARACRATMASLPYHGSTFADVQISEGGRALAVKLLRTLSPGQLNALFEAAGFSTFPHVLGAARQPQAWTDVFLAKVDEIANAGPCPQS